MEYKDYYNILGVGKNATEKEIKSTFRKLARQHHPDVNPDDPRAEARFKEINEAYEVLGDSDKRAKYDQLGADWHRWQQTACGTPDMRIGCLPLLTSPTQETDERYSQNTNHHGVAKQQRRSA